MRQKDNWPIARAVILLLVESNFITGIFATRDGSSMRVLCETGAIGVSWLVIVAVLYAGVEIEKRMAPRSLPRDGSLR